MTRIPPNFSDRFVCIFGMGYVGLTLAVIMAEAGFAVLGLETRQDILDLLRNGRSHFYEPGLEDKIRKLVCSDRLHFASSLSETHLGGVYIITVGTPLNEEGRVNLDNVVNVAREVSARLKTGDLVIMRSTVMLRTTRDIVVPILDQAGCDYDIAVCPERTLEGQALAELCKLPQIVGADLRARVRAAQLFSFITPTVIQVSSLETAEMIKLTDNTQRDVQFGFANEVARICDTLGVSASEVIAAGKLGYSRTNLPVPGLVGGPCLEKDSLILAEGLERFDIKPEIALAARRLNQNQPNETITNLVDWLIQNKFPAAPVILIAGLAFKGRPPTDDLRGTMARLILKELRTHFPKAVFRGFDPVVKADLIEKTFGITPVCDISEGMTNAHLVVITNNHPLFSMLSIDSLSDQMARPGLVYDYWNNFSAGDLQMPSGTAYMGLGARALTPAINQSWTDESKPIKQGAA